MPLTREEAGGKTLSDKQQTPLALPAPCPAPRGPPAPRPPRPRGGLAPARSGLKAISAALINQNGDVGGAAPCGASRKAARRAQEEDSANEISIRLVGMPLSAAAQPGPVL